MLAEVGNTIAENRVLLFYSRNKAYVFNDQDGHCLGIILWRDYLDFGGPRSMETPLSVSPLQYYYSGNCWFSVSRHIKIKIKAVQ